MGRPAIVVQALSKRYPIGNVRPSYDSLRDAITRSFSRRIQAIRSRRLTVAASRQYIAALDDVSFTVDEGDVVGVIGGNGAGKSTLLKVLSRITEPTSGRAEIRGRVGSLLEVGTGFHPELTGRENIYLNGAILGMPRRSITAKFDEILSFAEVERFVDTPVKHYSSGMYLRLAFAVAAHLEPEILVVDEVLAVGDASFQKKCIGKMSSAARGGRTVLFVSHNMGAVSALCTRVILLDKGQVLVDTHDVGAALSAYAGLATVGSHWSRATIPPSHGVFFEQLECELLGHQPGHMLRISGSLRSAEDHQPAFLAFDVVNMMSVPLMQALPNPEPFIPCKPREHRFSASIMLPPLVPGTYHVHAWIGSHYAQSFDFVENALEFSVSSSPTKGRSFPHSPDHGAIVPESSIMLEPSGEAVTCGV